MSPFLGRKGGPAALAKALSKQEIDPGLAAQIRALALNFVFIAVTRTTQRLDPTGGLSAAAHLVAIQLWQIGGVILFALSTVAQILVPAELSRPGGGARPR